jgi:hypothetical protein
MWSTLIDNVTSTCGSVNHGTEETDMCLLQDGTLRVWKCECFLCLFLSNQSWAIKAVQLTTEQDGTSPR